MFHASSMRIEQKCMRRLVTIWRLEAVELSALSIMGHGLLAVLVWLLNLVYQSRLLPKEGCNVLLLVNSAGGRPLRQQKPSLQAFQSQRASKMSSKKKKEKTKLPENLELQRSHVVCGPDVNEHVSAGLQFRSMTRRQAATY